MKNKLPCELVRDLMPGYIDGLSSKTTGVAVEEHLAECAECQAVIDRMMCESGKAPQINEVCENRDKQFFKKIKKKLNRRTKIIIGIAAAVVVVFTASFYTLFTAPIKSVDLADVKVSAEVYPVSELEKNEVSNDENAIVAGKADNEVKISSGTDDNSETFQVIIPDIDNNGIMITGSTLEKVEYVTIISWSSPYFLREISYDSKRNEESVDTIYISAFKTTVLDNKAQEYQSKMTQMEFRQINKIVFVGESGEETVLWENNKE